MERNSCETSLSRLIVTSFNYVCLLPNSTFKFVQFDIRAVSDRVVSDRAVSDRAVSGRAVSMLSVLISQLI